MWDEWTSTKDLQRLLAALPGRIRAEISGYLSQLRANESELFLAAEVDFAPELRDRLIFFAAVRKLWMLVESRYQILMAARALGQEYHFEDVVLGSSREPSVVEMHQPTVEMRESLRDLFERNGVLPLVEAPDILGLLKSLTRSR